MCCLRVNISLVLILMFNLDLSVRIYAENSFSKPADGVQIEKFKEEKSNSQNSVSENNEEQIGKCLKEAIETFEESDKETTFVTSSDTQTERTKKVKCDEKEDNITETKTNEIMIGTDISTEKQIDKKPTDSKKCFFNNLPIDIDAPRTAEVFRTVATRKAMGRLGNHIWAVMSSVAIKFKYQLDVAFFDETMSYMKLYFQDFDDCPSLERDYCGFDDFFEHFRDYLDSRIEHFFSEKVGKKLKFSRKGQQLSVPPEYGLKWKLNYKELVDTQEFIDNYSPLKFSTPNCQYQWEIFREEPELLLQDDYKFGRALLLYPGISKFNDVEVMEAVPNFEEIFFSNLKFHQKYISEANLVLTEIKKLHLSKKKATSNKTSKSKSKSPNDDHFIFVGIHARGTDHIKYELDKGFIPLKTQYYLDAMHLFRQHFRKESKKGRLVFLYVSDDMEYGRLKLEHRNRDLDLYFVGNGTVDAVDAIGRDLAIMAHCNHTIESHGSYSFFAGAMAGGFRIIPQHFQEYVSHGEVKFPDPFKQPVSRIYSRDHYD